MFSRIYTIRKCIWIFTTNERYISGCFTNKQLFSDLSTIRVDTKVTAFIKYIRDIDGRPTIVQVHKVNEPHNFFITVIHWCSREKKQSHIIHFLNNLEQYLRHAFISVIVCNTNIMNFIDNNQSICE